MYHCVMSCSRQTPNRLVCLFLAAGSEAKAEARALRLRPRPKFWPRGLNISGTSMSKLRVRVVDARIWNKCIENHKKAKDVYSGSDCYVHVCMLLFMPFYSHECEIVTTRV